jgi:hypothetical protein
MIPAYKNQAIRAELGEIRKGQNILMEADAIARDITENGIPLDKATQYINDNFLDLLSAFISGGIVSRTVREIVSAPEYSGSPEHLKSDKVATTYTLTRKLSVDLGKIYPYIDVSIRAGLIELRKIRFSFRLTGMVTVQNPRITVYRGKIIRATLGTVTPSFSLYYTCADKDRLIHTFNKPIAFSEIDLASAPEGPIGSPPAPAQA